MTQNHSFTHCPRCGGRVWIPTCNGYCSACNLWVYADGRTEETNFFTVTEANGAVSFYPKMTCAQITGVQIAGARITGVTITVRN